MGGVLFTSSLETLQSCPQSALASMFFKPSNPSAPGYYIDQSGAYFIDASPIVFRVILDWLRYRQLLFADRPHGSNFLTALRLEARDLGLPEMVKDIRRCEEEEMEKRKVAEGRAMQVDRLRSQAELKTRELKEFKERKSLIEEKKNHLEESMMLVEASRMKELWKRSADMVDELEQLLPVGDVNKKLSGGYDNQTISAGDGLVVEDNSSTSEDESNDDENDVTMKGPSDASGIGSVSGDWRCRLVIFPKQFSLSDCFAAGTPPGAKKSRVSGPSKKMLFKAKKTELELRKTDFDETKRQEQWTTMKKMLEESMQLVQDLMDSLR